MGEIMQVNFTYDPLYISRLVIRIFLEKHGKQEFNEMNFSERKIKLYNYASASMLDEYLSKDDILESYLKIWTDKFNIDVITFEEAMSDAKNIWDIIWASSLFENMIKAYQKQGHDGLGVFDLKANKFYPCIMAEHWPTVTTILESDYPEMYQIYEDFVERRINKYDSKVKEVDDFILENFKFLGAIRIHLLSENRY